MTDTPHDSPAMQLHGQIASLEQQIDRLTQDGGIMRDILGNLAIRLTETSAVEAGREAEEALLAAFPAPVPAAAAEPPVSAPEPVLEPVAPPPELGATTDAAPTPAAEHAHPDFTALEPTP